MADKLPLHPLIADFRKDAEDKRRKRGKYAPETGVCRVCHGAVVAEISYRNDGKIGGPPRPAYVSGWHCQECFIVYRQCPKPASTDPAV